MYVGSLHPQNWDPLDKSTKRGLSGYVSPYVQDKIIHQDYLTGTDCNIPDQQQNRNLIALSLSVVLV
ncbi:hypothetical protein V6Z12_D13G116600 [Gossypium hirsutum]